MEKGRMSAVDPHETQAVTSLPISSTLILGGARSGKSRYAQTLAEDSDLRPLLIATATAGDDEMAERIRKHQAERGNRWQLVEEPLDLIGALQKNAAPHIAIVVDCLTLWLSNLMFKDADVEAAGDALAASLPSLKGPVIFVSNEIGLGLVPETQLGRAFRDAQGRLNQKLAAACENVIFVAAGIPLQLKPNPLTLRR
jgi:adenosylcobinamide kinase/adenosylcobinamide-phosphate guanylyltransferase